MKKPDYKFKVREVLRPNSCKVFIVYFNSMTPLEYCWCTDYQSAVNIAVLLNRQFVKSEAFWYSFDEYNQVIDKR